MIPEAVLRAYAFAEKGVPATSGRINSTYILEGEEAVVQKLHPVFGPSVNLDLDAVTQRLTEQGLETPRLIRTTEGAPCVEYEGETWRAITLIDGVCIDRIERPAQASAAGRAVAHVRGAARRCPGQCRQ